MVIRIGIALAAASSPKTPQPVRACAPVPAGLSLRDRFLGSHSNGRKGTVGREKSVAVTSETSWSGSPPTVRKNYLARRAGSAASDRIYEPVGKALSPAEIAETSRFGSPLRCEKTILRRAGSAITRNPKTPSGRRCEPVGKAISLAGIAETSRLARLLWCERIILRGVLAMQSRATEGPIGPKIRGGIPMSITRLAAAAALAVSVALPAAAQGIPKVQSPEEVGFLSTRLKRLSDRLERGREEQRAARRRGPDRAQRQAGDVRFLRLPRQGSQGADDQRHHLPHRLDDQADRDRGRHDPGRGGQDQHRRSGVALHPGLRRHQGRGAEEERRRHGRDHARAAGAGR